MLGGGPGRPSRGQNRQAPMASSRCCGRLDHRVTATGTVTRTMSPNHPCPGACPAPSRRRARPGAGCFAEFADGGLGEGLARPDGSAAFPVAPGLPAHAEVVEVGASLFGELVASPPGVVDRPTCRASPQPRQHYSDGPSHRPPPPGALPRGRHPGPMCRRCFGRGRRAGRDAAP